MKWDVAEGKGERGQKGKLAELEKKFQQEVDRLEQSYHPAGLELEQFSVRPRKSDIEITPIMLVWTPWHVDASGAGKSAYLLPLPQAGEGSFAHSLFAVCTAPRFWVS